MEVEMIWNNLLEHCDDVGDVQKVSLGPTDWEPSGRRNKLPNLANLTSQTF